MQLGFLCDVQNQQKACCPFLLCLMSSLNTFSSAALCSFRSREFLLCPINLICTMIISLKWWYKTEDCLNFYAGFYPFYCFFYCFILWWVENVERCEYMYFHSYDVVQHVRNINLDHHPPPVSEEPR